jgi:hypothetical protein
MRSILCVVLALSLFGCAENKKEPKPQENIMVKQSEMAALMLTMYGVNETNKQKVLKGELPDGFPENFYNIHDAVLTSPSDRDVAFKAYSDFYLQNVKTFYNTTNVDSLVMNHNKVISSCITCHEVKCVGPVPKIKKLYIKEN